MARPQGIPGHLHHKASGRAYGRINGTDIYLGFHNSKESKAKYNRVISEWLANNRQLPSCSAHCQEQFLLLMEFVWLLWITRRRIIGRGKV
jgi:hypothetical protein